MEKAKSTKGGEREQDAWDVGEWVRQWTMSLEI